MSLTFFSAVMAMLLSTIFTLVIHFLQGRDFFLRTFGVRTVLFLYGLSGLRMALAIETPLTRVVPERALYNGFYLAAVSDLLPIADHAFSFCELALIIWSVGAALLLAQFMAESIKMSRKLQSSAGGENPLAGQVLKRIQSESPRRLEVKIVIHENIGVPASIGLFHKWICLPDRAYSEQELYYILKHEYTHFCNRDLEIKFLVRLFCCFFWWNPAVYLLKADVSRLLEIRCDAAVTEKFSKKGKLEYLAVIVRSIEDSRSRKTPAAPRSGAYLFLKGRKNAVVERFELVAKPMQKRTKKFQAACMALSLFIFFMSYMFILQPSYPAPPIEPPAVETATPADHVLKSSDGNYFLVFEDGTALSITEQDMWNLTEANLELMEE